MHKEYDFIISLGGFCAAAAQLRARGLRPTSYPFDWAFMDSPNTIQWLCDAFDNNFNDFFKKENLLPIERNDIGGLAPYKYRDKISGYGFIHHFWKPIDQGGFEDVEQTMSRRLKRMLACFAPHKKVLIILATTFPFDPSLAVKLLSNMRLTYPMATIDMHVMQFSARFDSPLTDSEHWPNTLPFTGGKYARAHSVYDLNRTSAEWSFLDNLCLTHATPRKPDFLTRISIKLWKRFSKRLRNQGLGFLGIRFK